MAGHAGANVGRYTLIELALHGLLYILLFLGAAFIARRNFVRRRLAAKDSGFVEDGEKTFTENVSAGVKELSEFVQDPIPFVLETSAADSDTVQYRAGLEARLYLHVLWSLMKLFALLTGVAILIVLPINILSSRYATMYLQILQSSLFCMTRTSPGCRGRPRTPSQSPRPTASSSLPALSWRTLSCPSL